MALLKIDARPAQVGRALQRSARGCFTGAKALVCILIALMMSGAAEMARSAEARHALAMHGEPALQAGFTRLRYANPDAPKGGRLVYGVLGTFDSLNPLIVKGIALPAIR